MAHTKTTDLAAAGALAGTEPVHTSQSDVSRQATIDVIEAAILTPNAICADMIQALAVGASEILANNVTGAKIATNTLTATQLGAGAVDTSELGVKSVDDIKAGDRLGQFYRRTGGKPDPNNLWMSAGVIAGFNSADCVFNLDDLELSVQFGFWEWAEVSGGTSGSQTITYPAAFKANSAPIVLTSPSSASIALGVYSSAAGNNATVDIYWESVIGAIPNPTTLGVIWVAVGIKA